MAKKLSQQQINRLLEIQSWGTYRQNEGELLCYNEHSNASAPIRSFTLDNVPVFDVLLVVGGFPRLVRYAAEIVMKCRSLGGRPELIATNCNLTSKVHWYFEIPGKSWTEKALIKMGFSETWVMQNHQDLPEVGNRIIDELNMFLYCSRTFGFDKHPKIAIVAEAGFSMELAQELGWKIDKAELLFFETPITPLEDRIFPMENFDLYGADLLLSKCFETREWEKIWRLPLPDKKKETAPTFQELNEFVRMGYGLGYTRADMCKEVGIFCGKGADLYRERVLELTGYDSIGRKKGEGLLEKDEGYSQARLDALLEEDCEYLMRKNLAPY